MNAIAAGSTTRQQLCMTHDHLRFAEEVQNYVEGKLAHYSQDGLRVRFVTSLDLIEILGRVNWNLAVNFRGWLLGDVEQLRYDAPKIVEAIVRLRLLGTGIPVFRLDWDVLFRGDQLEGNAATPDLGLFKAIVSCRQAFLLRRDESRVATFLLSASYDTSGVSDPDLAPRFDSWRGAFATRVFPAIPVVPGRFPAAADGWEDYLEEVFREDIARKFYGLTRKGLNSNGIQGIGSIGAHPLVSVISGAMLCLSEGAIVDLPPFSNFGINVSWIDDHLKYCLHRELRHLTTVQLESEPLLSDAKLDSVRVTKARGPITNFPRYVLGNYLPTLLWGTIMDAWITPDRLLKYRPEDGLSEEEQKRWHQLSRKGASGAILTKALQEALAMQHIANRRELEQRLIAEAVSRIADVRNEWMGLQGDDGTETFASIWAKGIVRNYFPGIDDRCLGMAPKIPINRTFNNIYELNDYLIPDFMRLRDDAVQYIDFTLHWPNIVQVVRSVEPGMVRFDVSWNG
jgi:hypothetical protein